MASSSVRRKEKEKEKEEEEVKKLREETIELLNKFFITVSATKTAVTVEERKVISSAHKKMSAIRRDLVRRNPPSVAAAAADIRECRSKIERQISGICNKLSNLTIQDSYRRHLHQFKTTSSHTTKRPPTTSQIYGQLKRKASTQQPPKIGRSRKQNSIKAQQDTSITAEEKNNLEKLVLEEEDYDETSRFIETSLRMHTTKEDRDVILTAYQNFIRVYLKQNNLIRSIQQHIDETYKGQDLNVSHMINNQRSIIVKELSNVCDKLSNPTIREAYLHHLDEFKTGAKPKTYTQRFINQKESPEIFFEMKGGSGPGSSKSLNRITKKPDNYEILEEDDDYEDDFYDIDENLERNFLRFVRTGHWDPIADLLHAPVNHSVKQELEDDYGKRHTRLMREVFKTRDIHQKRRVDVFIPFDF